MVPDSCRDRAQAVRVSLDFTVADPACESLPFEIAAPRQMWCAPRQAHEIFAFRTDRGVGDAEANWHAWVPFHLQGTNLLLLLAFQKNNN